MLLFALLSSSGRVVCLWSPGVMWHMVHWAVVMCMACYKRSWLVFFVCVLTLLELDHKMPSQKECYCLPFAISCPLPVSFIFILQCVCVLGHFYSLKGMLFLLHFDNTTEFKYLLSTLVSSSPKRVLHDSPMSLFFCFSESKS